VGHGVGTGSTAKGGFMPAGRVVRVVAGHADGDSAYRRHDRASLIRRNTIHGDRNPYSRAISSAVLEAYSASSASPLGSSARWSRRTWASNRRRAAVLA